MGKHEWLPASVGSLQLQLAETSVVPGATLQGTVTLALAERVECAGSCASSFCVHTARYTTVVSNDAAIGFAMEYLVITVQIEGLQRLQWGAVGGRGAWAQLQNLSFKHLTVEDTLGQLNGDLPPGVHTLPFETTLPMDLLATSSIERLVEKTPEKRREVWFIVEYSVSAKLEAAGLSSPNLQQTCLFEVVGSPSADPLAQPVAVRHGDSVRPMWGLGHVKPCTVSMQLSSDIVNVSSGLIEADVKIELPANLKLYHVHLVLYEDVALNISKNYVEGGQQNPRAVCRHTYNVKHFATEAGDNSSSNMTLKGRLQLKISDPDAKKFGPLVPSLTVRFLNIHHRIGVECSFVLGSRVSISTPITLLVHSMVKREQLPTSVGTLQLQLHASSVLPGAALRGTVTLNLPQPAEATVISVKIEALERMQWSGSGQYNPVPPQKVTCTHVDNEFTLGNLNGDLLPGIHSLPFEFTLPPSLVANSVVQGFVRKAVGKKRRVRVELVYTVSAKLEIAGLSSRELQQTCVFEITKPPLAIPLGASVAITHSDNVKPLMGFRTETPCVIHMQLTSNMVELPLGIIEVDVTIELPTKPKLHHVHVVLYEDVFAQNQYENGADQDSRAVCRRTYKAKHFTPSQSRHSSNSAVRGRVQLPISDPDAEAYGDLAPSFTTKFVQIRHRVGIECSFLLGSRVSLSAPVILVSCVAPPA